MKFGQPLLTSELSGAMGGAVASSARGGRNYFRVRARPANPRSPAQSTMRTILASLAAAWRNTLTGPQRAGWESIASSTESGINVYTGNNSQVLLAQETRVDAPPVSKSLAAEPVITLPSVDASAHTIDVEFPTESVATAVCNVFMTAQQSPSRSSRQNPYSFVGTYPAPLDGGASIAIPATHAGYNLTAGQIVYVRVVIVDPTSGRVAIGQEFRCIVVA